MDNFFNFLPTSNHLHPRLVVEEDNNGKFRLEKVKREHNLRGGIFFYIYIVEANNVPSCLE